MSSGERPIGTAKGKQPNTEALCQPPPPPHPRVRGSQAGSPPLAVIFSPASSPPTPTGGHPRIEESSLRRRTHTYTRTTFSALMTPPAPPPPPNLQCHVCWCAPPCRPSVPCRSSRVGSRVLCLGAAAAGGSAPPQRKAAFLQQLTILW